MPYWCAAQLEHNRVALATHHLKLSGYRVYAPRLRAYRFSSGRKVEERPLLFPSYAFVWIDLQWHRARWCCGVVRLIMAGDATPARVPDAVIDGLRASEGRDGLIELPKPPRFQRGDRVRITRGPFREHLALYDGQTASQRIAVLLRLLGSSERRVELPEDAVEAVR
jgi:transcriptional antiterminator RfaH